MIRKIVSTGLVFWDAMIFCNNFARWLQKIATAMCWVFWDATIFCNNFMLSKRRFWKAKSTFQNAFSKHFSTFRSPNPVLTPFKKASKMQSDVFIQLCKMMKASPGAARHWYIMLMSIHSLGVSTIGCSPNEDFGNRNKRFVSFRRSFNGL